MPINIPRVLRHLLRASSATSIALLSVLALGTSSAQAHAKLISTSPGNGAVLVSAPAQVLLIFEDPLIPDLATVSINSSDGTNISSAKIQPNESNLAIPWPKQLPAGEYEVAYRVVSEDGHPVTGAITFSFGKASPWPTAIPRAAGQEPDGSTRAAWAIAAAAVLLGLSIAVIYVLARRRR